MYSHAIETNRRSVVVVVVVAVAIATAVARSRTQIKLHFDWTPCAMRTYKYAYFFTPNRFQSISDRLLNTRLLASSTKCK